MSQPSSGTAPLRWATAPLIPADVVAPDTTHMDHGWQAAEEPPHSFLNYWQNLVYLWIVYLANISAEALTWTALETFNAGIVVGNPSAAAVTATATYAVSGSDSLLSDLVAVIKGTITTATDGGFMAGVFGKGNANAPSSIGVAGLGGANSASGLGGYGGYFVGGAQTSTNNNITAGTAGFFSGGTINGAVNSQSNANGGNGLTVNGGDILSDANGRKGGTGLRIRAGQGQAGYGKAIDSFNGDWQLANGNFTITGSNTATVPNLVSSILAALTALTVSGAATITGLLTANGGISATTLASSGNSTIGGTLTVTGLTTTNGFLSGAGGIGAASLASSSTITASSSITGNTLIAATGGSSIPLSNANSLTPAGSWSAVTEFKSSKDPFGVVHLQGGVNGGTGTMTTLPAGQFPTIARTFVVATSGGAGVGTVGISTSGVVSYIGGGTGNIFVDGITFRTT